MRTERIKTDVLIIGGGTAGCFAAYVIGQKSERKRLLRNLATRLYGMWLRSVQITSQN